MKSLTFVIVGIILLSLSQTGCKFYKVTRFYPQNSGSEQEMLPTNVVGSRLISHPFIQVIAKNKYFELVDYQVQIAGSDTLLAGNLVRLDSTFIPEPQFKTFLRSRIPKELRGNFAMVQQLFTADSLEEGPIKLNLSDLDHAQYFRVAKGASVLGTTTIVLGSVAVGIGTFLAIACSCPRVYATGESGPELQGSLFTGSISQSLARTDYLPLNGLDRSKDQIEISIHNELPETEYLDQVQLLKAKPTPGAKLGMGVGDQLFEYQTLHAPTKAHTANGVDLLARVEQWDQQFYDFDQQLSDQALNEAIFTFDVSNLKKDQAQLVIQARQTEWVQVVADYFFSLFGTDFDRWSKRMDRVPRNTYEARTAERGISMNAYLNTANGWKLVGTYHNAGIVQQKTLGIPIDLSHVKGQEIELKLTSAHKFWELDQIGLSDDWQAFTQYEPVPLLGATNEAGMDIQAQIAKIDGSYHILPTQTSRVDLVYAHTAAADEVYILQGTGYYHHQRSYDYPAQRQILKSLKKGEITTHQLSIFMDQAQTYVSTQN